MKIHDLRNAIENVPLDTEVVIAMSRDGDDFRAFSIETVHGEFSFNDASAVVVQSDFNREVSCATGEPIKHAEIVDLLAQPAAAPSPFTPAEAKALLSLIDFHDTEDLVANLDLTEAEVTALRDKVVEMPGAFDRDER